MIEIGFVTDIDELMWRRHQDRMVVRKAAWAELTAAFTSMAGVLVRDAVALATPFRARPTAAS